MDFEFLLSSVFGRSFFLFFRFEVDFRLRIELDLTSVRKSAPKTLSKRCERSPTWPAPTVHAEWVPSLATEPHPLPRTETVVGPEVFLSPEVFISGICMERCRGSCPAEVITLRSFVTEVVTPFPPPMSHREADRGGRKVVRHHHRWSTEVVIPRSCRGSCSTEVLG